MQQSSDALLSTPPRNAGAPPNPRAAPNGPTAVLPRSREPRIRLGPAVVLALLVDVSLIITTSTVGFFVARIATRWHGPMTRAAVREFVAQSLSVVKLIDLPTAATVSGALFALYLIILLLISRTTVGWEIAKSLGRRNRTAYVESKANLAGRY